MDTSKVSLPPIRQMLYDLSRDHYEKNESNQVPLSSTCSRPSDHNDKQLNYLQGSLPMKHNNNKSSSSSTDAYIFDAWHECLSPTYLSPGSKTVESCQCAPNGIIHATSVSAPPLSPPLSGNYNRQQPRHHRHWQQHDSFPSTSNHPHLYPHDHHSAPRHRRAHSASHSTQPLIRKPTASLSSASPPPPQQRHQPFLPYQMHQGWSPKLEWRSPSPAHIAGGKSHYGGRMRAHTTSGYLPTAARINPTSASMPVSLPIQTNDVTFSSSPSCSESSSSSSSSPAASLSPTSSSSFTSPFNTMIKAPAHLYSHMHPHNDSSHVTLPPSSGTAMRHPQQQQQQQRHRYHCPHCRKTFSRPSSLRIHVYSHTGEKPHVCPYLHCGRRFSVQSNMRRHIRVHVGNSNNNNNINANTGIGMPHGEHHSPMDGDPFPRSAADLHMDHPHYRHHHRLQQPPQQHQQQSDLHPHSFTSHLMLHGH